MAASSVSSTTSDLPGYSYDESKNRYFKIPPSHCTELPSFSSQSKPVKVCSPKPSPDLSLYNLFHKRQLGIVPAWDPRSHFKCAAKALSLSGKVTIPIDPDIPEDISDFTAIDNMWVSDNGDGVILVNSTYNDIRGIYRPFQLFRGIFSSDSDSMQWDWSFDFDGGVHESMELKFLGAQVDSKTLYLTDLDILMAVANEYQDLYFYSVERPTGTFYRFPFPWNTLRCNSLLEDVCTRCGDWSDLWAMGTVYSFSDLTCFCISPEATLDYRVFAIGGNETTQDLDIVVETKYLWNSSVTPLRSHGQSSVTSMAFGPEGSQLFAGYKSGKILGWDFRIEDGSCVCKNRSPSVNLNEPKEGKVCSSVCAIQPLKDSNYIISSAYNSKLSLWDVRMRAKVLQYKGHVNNYSPHRYKMVDNDEKYLFAVGSDSCVRLWSIGDGQLLRTITPDELPYAHDDCPPLVSYTDTLGGERYNPALIVCDHKHLCFFKPSV